MISIITIAQVLTGPDLNTLPNHNASDPTQNILELAFGIAGAIALIIITIGALQYVISQGNPQATNKAKDTILYAVIGLVVCILAYSIVKFVANSL